MKRVFKFWIACWKASHKTKVVETKYWIQYYSVWTNNVWIERNDNYKHPN